ncbi:unnamed protein product [Sphagnum jensenii]|uniref:Uncharacterized protein n=2 Tax=Sphagnum jensenii TaxID=128206 RepID=A0ABP1BHD9_9BRYO
MISTSVMIRKFGVHGMMIWVVLAYIYDCCLKTLGGDPHNKRRRVIHDLMTGRYGEYETGEGGSQSGGTPPLSLDQWGEQTVLAICRIPLEPRISTRSYHGSILQLRTYPFSSWTHVG